MRRALAALLKPFEVVRSVPIDRCYHYRAHRYGGFGNNPYEDYCIGLAQGAGREALRARFAEIVLHCAPRTLGEALQMPLGDRPLWSFPWSRRRADAPPADPRGNVDVMCYYYEKGVLASQIHQEFRWLESAFARMRGEGYNPRAHSYIHCLELRASPERSSYLVLDGNHRLAALHALGARDVAVRLTSLKCVDREQAARWPRVRDASYSLGEALAVFERYFWLENPPLQRTAPVPLIEDEPLLWR